MVRRNGIATTTTTLTTECISDNYVGHLIELFHVSFSYCSCMCACVPVCIFLTMYAWAMC